MDEIQLNIHDSAILSPCCGECVNKWLHVYTVRQQQSNISIYLVSRFWSIRILFVVLNLYRPPYIGYIHITYNP